MEKVLEELCGESLKSCAMLGEALNGTDSLAEHSYSQKPFSKAIY